MRNSLIVILFLCFSTFVFAQDSDSFLFAKKLYLDGLYDEAIQQLEIIIQEDRTSSTAEEALSLLAESYKLKGNSEKAELYYRQLWENFSGSANLALREKTLFALANSEFTLHKWNEAANYYYLLILKFPLSDLTKNSLLNAILALYNAGDYNNAIVLANDLQKNYPTSVLLPDILYWQARCMYANLSIDQMKTVFNTLTTKYPSSDARWKAYLFSLQMQEPEKGKQYIINELSSTLKTNLQRSTEEFLRLQLIQYLFALNDYESASVNLKLMINKFDHSDSLDYYIFMQSNALLKCAHYQDLAKNGEKERLSMIGSPYQIPYLINLMHANTKAEQYQVSSSIYADLSKLVIGDTLLYEKEKELAFLYTETKRIKPAIQIYQNLITHYPQNPQNANLYISIGDLYFECFQNYSSAIHEYQLSITTSSDQQLQATAYFKLASCYEHLNNLSMAKEQLIRIRTDLLSDSTFIKEINNKLQYIELFRERDFETATSSLIQSLQSYLQTNDTKKLQLNLARIMADNLKDYQSASVYLHSLPDLEAKYRLALAFLKLAQKADLEGNDQAKNAWIDSLQLSITQLQQANATEYFLELTIENRFLLQHNSLTSADAQQTEKFITDYPLNPMKNQYLLRLIDFYQSTNNQQAKLVAMLKVSADNISDMHFAWIKQELADAFLNQKQYDLALKAYMQASQLLTVEYPSIYFHYCLCLYNQNQKEKAIAQIQYLLSNVTDFSEISNAMALLSDYCFSIADYNAALQYAQKVAVDFRDDAYYVQLKKIYYKQGNIPMAKEAIMHIKQKSVNDLYELADLHYQTKDYVFAEYTYNQILKSETNKQKVNFIYNQLGHIAYLQQLYDSCLSNYAKVIPISKAGIDSVNSSTLDLKQPIMESILCLYKISNRPRAENMKDRFSKMINSDLFTKNSIDLAEAVYYLSMDKEKGLKLINDIIQNNKFSVDLQKQAYYARGMYYIQAQQNDLALNDFLKSTKAANTDTRVQSNFRLGTLFYAKQDYPNALTYYYQVIQEDSTGKYAIDAAQNFAVICKIQEDWQKAIQAYQKILTYPDNRELSYETLFNIAYCYLMDKQYSKAIEMFTSVLSTTKKITNPSSAITELQAETEYWIGECYYNMKQYDSAVTSFLKVSYDYSDVTRWCSISELRAGETYLKLQKAERAHLLFDKIIKRYGETSDIGKAAKQYMQ